MLEVQREGFGVFGVHVFDDAGFDGCLFGRGSLCIFVLSSGCACFGAWACRAIGTRGGHWLVRLCWLTCEGVLW